MVELLRMEDRRVPTRRPTEKSRMVHHTTLGKVPKMGFHVGQPREGLATTLECMLPSKHSMYYKSCRGGEQYMPLVQMACDHHYQAGWEWRWRQRDLTRIVNSTVGGQSGPHRTTSDRQLTLLSSPSLLNRHNTIFAAEIAANVSSKKRISILEK